MSQQRTLFMKLPNEIIYSIFEFLTSTDILRAFAHLNYRYDSLIRSYIKTLDLIDGWNGNQQDIQWICPTIERLRIDRFNIYAIADCQFLQLHSLFLKNICEWNTLIANMNLKTFTVYFDEKRFYSFNSKPDYT